MGTRSLTVVIADGEHLTTVIAGGERKVAQYGQYDGYPAGQGAEVVEFIRDMVANGKEAEFLKKLDLCRFVDDDEDLTDEMWVSTPTLRRDMAAKVLGVILNAEEEVLLSDQYEFATDSLFCEFVYVVNMDHRNLEMYRGFNKTPLAEGERFKGLQGSLTGETIEYYPVRLYRTWSFDDLPDMSQVEDRMRDEDETKR